jgi:hypothetical protein
LLGRASHYDSRVRSLWTPGRVYVVGFVSLALVCSGAVLTSQGTHRTLAIALSVVGALGLSAADRGKRQQSKDP